MKLKDQVAIVTGAGRNIGEEVAKLFAAEGARIAVVDLDRPRGQHDPDFRPLRPPSRRRLSAARVPPTIGVVHLYDINWPSVRSFLIQFLFI